MTEAIKQWIERQCEGGNNYPVNVKIGIRKGLTYGLLIAEGFAEWTQETGWHKSGEWWFFGSGIRATTSDLLKKYIQQLDK